MRPLSAVVLHNYFNRYLLALDIHSSMGVQLMTARLLSHCSRRSAEEQGAPPVDSADRRAWQRNTIRQTADLTRYTVSDDVLECVSLLRPVERRLSMLAPEHRDTLRAYYTEPEEPAAVREWQWLEREGGLPLALMVLAARKAQVTLKQLVAWGAASTSAERIERGRGVAKVKAQGEQMLSEAHRAWNDMSQRQPVEVDRMPVAAE